MWRIVVTAQAEGGQPFTMLHPRRFVTRRGAGNEAKRTVTETYYQAIKKGAIDIRASYKLIKEGEKK